MKRLRTRFWECAGAGLLSLGVASSARAQPDLPVAPAAPVLPGSLPPAPPTMHPSAPASPVPPVGAGVPNGLPPAGGGVGTLPGAAFPVQAQPTPMTTVPGQ